MLNYKIWFFFCPCFHACDVTLAYFQHKDFTQFSLRHLSFHFGELWTSLTSSFSPSLNCYHSYYSDPPSLNFIISIFTFLSRDVISNIFLNIFYEPNLFYGKLFIKNRNFILYKYSVIRQHYFTSVTLTD